MPGTVCVACRIPTGIVIEACFTEEYQEAVMGGGTRTVKRSIRKGQRFVCVGPAVRLNGKPVMKDIRHGVGLTHNVDADVFEEWLKQQGPDSEIVKNKLVFAHSKQPEVEAQARDFRDEKSGLEAIDPHSLPPEFRRKITTADQQKP